MAEETKNTVNTNSNGVNTKTKKLTKKRKQKKKKKLDFTKAQESARNGQATYPRHTMAESLRIPRAILEQNAGKECSDSEAAKFLNLSLSGNVQMEIGSALRYGFLERPSSKRVKLSELVAIPRFIETNNHSERKHF